MIWRYLAVVAIAVAAFDLFDAQTSAGEVLRDCATDVACPEMIVIPASSDGAQVGSQPRDVDRQSDETPHPVALSSFAIGKRSVSVAEYGVCVARGACRPPEWDEPGGEANVKTGTSAYYRGLGEAVTDPARPVVGVSWDDARAYAAWLATATGKPYRLPSETEWEYAARAGSRARYWWGDDERPDGRVMANCAGCGSRWDRRGAAPPAMLPANPFGLEDVAGGVWQWTADVYCGDFERSAPDGAARTAADCPSGGDLRVLRGGSSFSPPPQIRASIRLRNRRSFRSSSVGFRVARSVGG